MVTSFTPYAALSGGVLIGLSAILLMWSLGRIMGATGILEGFIFPKNLDNWSWRAATLLGMALAPLIIYQVSGNFPSIQIPISTGMLVIGAFIVGVGVTLGSGCTSGHGVCGMARFSPRSIAATVTFMATTAITIYIIRHVLGA